MHNVVINQLTLPLSFIVGWLVGVGGGGEQD